MFMRVIKRLFFTSRRRAAPTVVVRDPRRFSKTRNAPRPQRQHVQALVGAVFRGKAYIIDGDTLRIGKTRIRMAGLDAPELDEPWGNKAKWELFAMCKGQIITARATGEVSYNRVVATCYLPDGTDLCAEMVRSGLALDLTPYSGGKYRQLEPSGARGRFRNMDLRQQRTIARYPEMLHTS